MSGAPIRESAILLACRCARAIERLLPVRFFWILCWLPAAFQAAWQLTFGTPSIRHYDRLPTSRRTRPGRLAWIAELWTEVTRLKLARLMYLWPDRLSGRRWADRCRCDGLEQLEHKHAHGRPVVLATLHFGPSILLAHWLRARGLRAAGLRDSSTAARSLYWRFIDRLSGIAGRSDGPSVFDRTELRPLYEHLRAGGILVITAEGRHHRHVRVRRDGVAIDMASGLFRLAAGTGAIVIPCLIAAGPRISFTIHLGEPVPDKYVVDAEHHDAAGDHLLREFLGLVGRHPGQCHSLLIEHLRPADDGVPSAAEAIPETTL